MKKELTDAEIERIDKIQNLTHEYINSLLPDGKAVEFDLNMVNSVIEAVWDAIKDKGVCTEKEFYPYRDSDDEPDGGEDPSVDCFDFVWADAALADDHCRCCKMCANYDTMLGKCGLGVAG